MNTVKKRSLIWFKYGTTTKPVLEIEDKNSQAVIRFIPYGAEHITVHLRKDGTLVKNFSLPHVAEPRWERETTRIAQMCYKDWEKHLKYAFAELPLQKIDNVKGYHLLGKLIDLNAYIPKSKYTRRCDFEVKVPYPKFMLNLYLGTQDNPCDKSLDRFQTVLGDLCFEFTRPIKLEVT